MSKKLTFLIIQERINLICFLKTDTEIHVAFNEVKDLEILEKYISKNLELKLFLADKICPSENVFEGPISYATTTSVSFSKFTFFITQP